MKLCSDCKSLIPERSFSEDGAEEDYFCPTCVDYVSILGGAEPDQGGAPILPLTNYLEEELE